MNSTHDWRTHRKRINYWRREGVGDDGDRWPPGCRESHHQILYSFDCSMAYPLPIIHLCPFDATAGTVVIGFEIDPLSNSLGQGRPDTCGRQVETVPRPEWAPTTVAVERSTS